MSVQSQLAINGGQKALRTSWPTRGLITGDEKNAVCQLLDRAIESGEGITYNGPEEEAYCREFADSLGGGYADAVNSGTNALYVALRALELEPFTEVICPPVTDPGGLMPVPLCNLIPVPADAAPNSYNVGPEQIEARLTPRTSAIMVTHIAGIPADIAPILEIAQARGIPVIEDCAQTHGALYHGRPVGTFGTISAFSTMFGKHHSTGGQGGIVFTHDEALYWKVRQYADRGKPFGVPDATANIHCALNCNMSEIGAAIGRVQLARLPEMVATRRKLVQYLAAQCQALETIDLVTGPADAEPSYWFLFFRLAIDRLSVDKATFVNALAAEGLPVGPTYLNMYTRHEWYKQHAVFGTSGLPWSSPLYQGDPHAEYPLPNILATDAVHFLMTFHERVSCEVIDDVVMAMKKVEDAYLVGSPV